ncbi:MAG: nitrile hydratase accessory protein [Pseudomonadota bacterium]
MTPQPGFGEPWQAQLHAVTDMLCAAGIFTATEWSTALGAALRAHENAGAMDGQQDYYEAWLDAIEALLSAKGLADKTVLDQIRLDWEAAFQRTPHGQPVVIAEPS